MAESWLNDGERERITADLKDAEAIAASVCGWRGDAPRANAAGMAAVFAEIRQMRREGRSLIPSDRL